MDQRRGELDLKEATSNTVICVRELGIECLCAVCKSQRAAKAEPEEEMGEE